MHSDMIDFNILLLQLEAIDVENDLLKMLAALDKSYLQVESVQQDWINQVLQAGNKYDEYWLAGSLCLKKFLFLYQKKFQQLNASLLVSHLIFIRLMTFAYCWSQMNYDFSLVDDYWLAVYDIYQSFQGEVSDNFSFVDEGQTLWTSSLEKEFFSLLLLAVSGLDSLLTHQFLLTLHVIQEASLRLVKTEHTDSKILIYCDMSQALAPKRFFTIDGISEKHATFKLLITFAELTDICHVLLKNMSDPDSYSIQSIEKLLTRQWRLLGEYRRGYERCKVDGQKVKYLVGYNSLQKVFQLDPRIYQSDELFFADIVDMSITGFSFFIDKLHNGEVSVGALLTIMMPDAVSWRVGLVRRVQRLKKSGFLLGVEVLSGAPIQGFVCAGDVDQQMGVSYPSVVMPDYRVHGGDSIAIVMDKCLLPSVMEKDSVLHIMEAFFLRMLCLCSVFYVGVDFAIIICSDGDAGTAALE